ncbi:hypothetical protein LTR84_008491 [Exophiala bonariae]|uniref:Uncharacterized protein n=1 Tax=Exophiala bonariae TaxID=1690606 RepID=A0AAV9N037_9EURO|nr:hypothetical protein LTR84_008491 [Exophiala bonariae]
MSTSLPDLLIIAPNISIHTTKPVVIGIYGKYLFIEGFEVIPKIVPGGLAKFQTLKEEEKKVYRSNAIDHVAKDGEISGRTTILTGHYMFWADGAEEKKPVWTLRDQATFTHIIYLSIPVDLLLARRKADLEWTRSKVSVENLHKWQETEKSDLRRICGENGILFTVLPFTVDVSKRAAELAECFDSHTETGNFLLAEQKLDNILKGVEGKLEKMLVIDADRILSATDTGHLFWEHVRSLPNFSNRQTSPKTIFSTSGYSHTAFRQVALLYGEVSASHDFDSICHAVANATDLYSGIISLLKSVTRASHVGVFIVTCGLSQVWEHIIAREGISDTVKVLGSELSQDACIVTLAVKTAVVSRLQRCHRLEVWAFGDSVLDLGMLVKADHAIVVVGDVESRSKTMDVPWRSQLTRVSFMLGKP